MPLKIVGLGFGVDVRQLAARVREKRRRLGYGSQLGLRIFLVNFVGMIRLGLGDDRAGAAWPSDLNIKLLRFPNSERSQRLIAREISAAGHHLLRLNIRPTANGDPRADPPCVALVSA